MMIRPAYSLIELIAALMTATVIIAGLASTISISTQLLESPTNQDSMWHDQEIADRLASDLRYATAIQDNYGYGFQITRPEPETGGDQIVTYQSYQDGLTRQVTGIPTMLLDSEAPSYSFQVDGYTAATAYTNKTVRVRSVTTAESDDEVTSLAIETPPGSIPNDLMLLCISGKTPDYVGVSESGWQTIHVLSRGNLRLTVLYRTYDSTYPASTTITCPNTSALSAVLVSIEDAYLYSPISWSGTDGGYCFPWANWSKPSPLETSGYASSDLNLQIIAAEGHPWPQSSIGMASFVDVGQTDAVSSDWRVRNSVVVVVRNDQSPTLSSTPRAICSSLGNWLQIGIKIEAAQ